MTIQADVRDLQRLGIVISSSQYLRCACSRRISCTSSHAGTFGSLSGTSQPRYVSYLALNAGSQQLVTQCSTSSSFLPHSTKFPPLLGRYKIIAFCDSCAGRKSLLSLFPQEPVTIGSRSRRMHLDQYRCSPTYYLQRELEPVARHSFQVGVTSTLR